MLEDNLMGSDGHAQVADRRFADATSVNPDFGPGGGVQVHDTLRQIERQRRHLARAHLHDTRRTIAKRVAHEVELVTPTTGRTVGDRWSRAGQISRKMDNRRLTERQ